MRNSLGSLQDGCDLCVRSREKTGDLLGQGLVAGNARQLVLPEIEIASRQPVELGAVVLFGGHGGTIAHRPANASVMATSWLRGGTLLVALRHRV
jgi:hypothetical protein